MTAGRYKIISRGQQIDGGGSLGFHEAIRVIVREREAGATGARAVGVDRFGRERELRASEVQRLADAAARSIARRRG
jgi:hypothetical protein